MTDPMPRGPSDFDPLDPEFATDPHPTWDRLRREHPVAYGGRWDFWALTRYDDITRVSRHPRMFTSARGITVPSNPVSGRRAPLHFDPPEHPRYRRPLNAVFSAQRAEAVSDEVRAIARELVARLVADGGGDVVAGLSSPLTAATFGLFVGVGRPVALEVNQHSERFEWAQGHREPAVAESENQWLYAWCRRLVAQRRAAPLDPGQDMVSALLAVEEDGAGLDDEFIAGSLRQLLIAAHVAPTALIASAVKHLALAPELQQRLRASPELVADAGEELLRLYTPNQGFSRTAVADTCVGGQPIAADQQVALVLSSANRDEAVFDCPGEFVLHRSPNPHLAFGHGAHKCAGQAVARLELRVALQELLAATSTFELGETESPLGWPLYGPEVLELRCAPADRARAAPAR